MVCSSCNDSRLRATPLDSAMNTAFPEALWAWQNGIWVLFADQVVGEVSGQYVGVEGLSMFSQ